MVKHPVNGNVRRPISTCEKELDDQKVLEGTLIDQYIKIYHKRNIQI